MALLSPEECQVDACILGTGLTESIAAAALARLGRRVLHIDREGAYGGNWRALSLLDLEAWAGFEEEPELLAGGDFRSLPPQAWHALHALFEPRGLVAPAFRPAPRKPVPPTPEPPAVPLPEEATAGGLRAIPLETKPPPSCYSCMDFAWDPFGTWDKAELTEKKEALRRSSNQFSMDLVPRLLFGRSDTVDVLVESGVARYLEFQGLKSAKILTATGLAAVPLTKSEIFQDAHLRLPEKRALMRFITSMAPFVGSLAFQSAAQLGVDQAQKISGPSDLQSSAPEGTDLQEPWHQFLERHKLSERLQDFLTYAICLWDWAPKATLPDAHPGWPELSCADGLKRMGYFVSSLGLYGRGTGMPLLYPMYGVSEIAQGFTRMCALHRGVYALRTHASHVLVSSRQEDATVHASTSDPAWRVAGIVTQRGEVVHAKTVLSSCDHMTQEGADMPTGQDSTAICRRMTVLLDCPLLGEEGVNLCVVPPSSMEPPLCNVVQVLQLDWSTGTCPHGYNLVHLSQAWLGPEGPGTNAFSDLQRVLSSLLALCGGDKHCLFRCSYIHRQRSLCRWRQDSPDGEALAACSSDIRGGLGIVSDPTAVPQLLAADEVSEARRFFAAAPGADGAVPSPDDFLRKPTHVAEEEKGNAMEELECFNVQMQEAANAPSAANSALLAAIAEQPTSALVADGGHKEKQVENQSAA